MMFKGFITPSFHNLVKSLSLALKALADGEPSADLVARAWIVWGALQAECSFPASPLDPSIVNAYKIAITQSEVCMLGGIL